MLSETTLYVHALGSHCADYYLVGCSIVAALAAKAVTQHVLCCLEIVECAASSKMSHDLAFFPVIMTSRWRHK